MSHPRPSSRPVRIAVAGVAFAALGAAAWLFTNSADIAPVAATAPQPAAPVHSTANDTVGSDAQRDTADRLGWLGAPAGSRFHHRIDDRSAFTIHNPEAGSQDAGALHLTCVVQTTVLARRSGEALLEQRVDTLRFLGADGRELSADAIQDGMQAAAATPVTVRIDERGAVLGYGFADGLDGDQHNFLRGVLGVLAFRAPAAAATTWECDEADTTGEYRARYEVVAALATTATVRRTRLAYTAMAGQDELPKHELSGAGEATFDRKIGWLEAARIDERMQFTLPLLELSTTVNRLAVAERIGSEVVAVAAGEADWQRANAPATGRFETVGNYAAESERHRWQQLLQGTTLEQLLAEVARLLTAQPLDHDGLDAAFQKLQWMVKLDDRAAIAIKDQVLARGLQADVAGTALSSLGAAGTKAAQDALVAVRNDRTLPLAVREHATVSTLQLAKPEADVVESLVRDAGSDFDGRSNAMLVLGALAPRSQPLADGRSPLQALLAMEADAAARGDLANWLLAVGNAAPAETMAIVQRHIGDQDPAVRASALVALRRVATSAAIALLIERGLGDAVAAVRNAALSELARRDDAAAWQAIARVAQQDAEESLRNKAHELLRAHS
ncbi:MAG: HEAT repeat domain-containing protein [Planctomycetes bacterium]|nr:HEAT repeat domain-containing protein [Planctomycetota bacterium]